MPEAREDRHSGVRYFWLLPDGPVGRFTRRTVTFSVLRDGQWIDPAGLLGDVVLDPMPGEAREITEGEAMAWIEAQRQGESRSPIDTELDGHRTPHVAT